MLGPRRGLYANHHGEAMSNLLASVRAGDPEAAKPRRRFQFLLIKPSHYDDDGYVIQWFRSIMPSNSLAALYGLAVDAAERRILGPDIEIDVIPIDETNTRVQPRKIIKQFK